MKTLSIARALLATAFITSATCATAYAGQYTYSDALTADSPSFVRVGRSFGDYRYSTFEFNTSQTGAYQIDTQAPTYDGYLFLYSGLFDPESPSTNLLQSSDDGTNFTNSFLTAQLVAGVNYFAVNTTYSVFSSNAYFYPNAAGFTTTISGPGNITALNAVSAVPEPETLSMLLAGLGLMSYVVKRRKQGKSVTGRIV